jgi:hypothetical protein
MAAIHAEMSEGGLRADKVILEMLRQRQLWSELTSSSNEPNSGGS